MKKLFSFIAIALFSISVVLSAQAGQTKPVTTKKTSTTTAQTTHTKADGTPDKRYKENKSTTTHTKKNGTPDMRYKENKKSTTTKTTKS